MALVATAAYTSHLWRFRCLTGGDAACGGDSSAAQNQLQSVQSIQHSMRAFAAILRDGSVVIWGDADYGGDSASVQALFAHMQQIQASSAAFAAILDDGSVVTSGSSVDGGNSRTVQDRLTNVQQIQATESAFAAIVGDGSVVTWGVPGFGVVIVLSFFLTLRRVCCPQAGLLPSGAEGWKAWANWGREPQHQVGALAGAKLGRPRTTESCAVLVTVVLLPARQPVNPGALDRHGAPDQVGPHAHEGVVPKMVDPLTTARQQHVLPIVLVSCRASPGLVQAWDSPTSGFQRRQPCSIREASLRSLCKRSLSQALF